MHAMTLRLSGAVGGLRRRAPRIGEHSEEILGEFGAATEDVAALASKAGHPTRRKPARSLIALTVRQRRDSQSADPL